MRYKNNKNISFFRKILRFMLLLIFINIILNARGIEIKDEHINDLAKILKETDKKSLEELLIKFNKMQNIEIKVIVINSLKDYVQDEMVIQEYVKELFNSERIKFLDKQKAILFFIALNDRKLHYEYGEQIPVNIISILSSVIDNKIIPCFKNEEYSRGIYEGIMEFIKKTGGRDKNKFIKFTKSFYIIISIFILFFIILLFKIKNRKISKVENFGAGAFGSWE